MTKTVNARITPAGRMEILSRAEIARLRDSGASGLNPLFRSCALAVLASGSDLDDGRALLEKYQDFAIDISDREHGLCLDLVGAPASAFVDGEMIKGIHEHVFAVLRDVVFISNEIIGNPRFDLGNSAGITDAVFHILRNADVLKPTRAPNLVVCWGGHSIPREEYDYTKLVGYELGLRGFDICTGCGPGAMKGPMKGAAIAHAKQRIDDGRYLGFSEPGIIAAESPNPIVNDLVVLPDIEKRLEAFVRTGHGIIVFPGGVGTLEEILYLLGILMHPDNDGLPFPLIFTGPASSAAYFDMVDRFIAGTLGRTSQDRYHIIIDNPAEVARTLSRGIEEVRTFRSARGDGYSFNWRLAIGADFQLPFNPSHANMRSLNLSMDQPVHLLAASLRRAFSGVVAGNVKEQGILDIHRYGPYELFGDARLLGLMDELLGYLITQKRMKLSGTNYSPCYRLVARGT